MKESFHNTITVPLGGIELSGELVIPGGAESLILFSHGSGSSRFSPRNNFVAKELQKGNIGTFLFDLLTESEDITYSNRFDIDLLTARLIQVTKYITAHPEFSRLTLGYFGASTGAASALKAAAALPDLIHAVVSRGGRPDLALDKIGLVQAPTLLIVGGLDSEVIEMNKMAYTLMKCPKKLEIIAGASHLFQEPNTLEQVAHLAKNWFSNYLVTQHYPL